MAAVVEQLPQRAVRRFDRVGRVDDLPDVGREVEEWDDALPVRAPRGRDHRVPPRPPGLDDRRWEGGLDGFRKAFETVAASDQDVLYAAVLELVDNLQPELRALVLLDPQPQDFLASGQSHPEGDVDRFVAHDALIADFHDERIEIDDRIDGVEGPRLPGHNVLGHRRRDT